MIKASIANAAVHKFDQDGAPLAAHVSDVIALYVLLVSKILQGSAIPSGARGYYFATAHRIPWWETLQRLAIFLHARGLVTSKSVSTWPSDEMAAESLGFPRHFVRGMGTATPQLVPVNAYEQLEWQPKWTLEMFWESLEDEVDAVRESREGRASIYDALT
ncbi:hypothetical protein LTR09_006558 [Extremus antarcticus]|uniref:Uncharacterized protein n=1 Tax=Extremus antarcticus TaxID=702011 RepID=A0AAJ0DE99_9PEZI|nr:hypothetical protein LTR09_006558 [Extremus antarcticus]